MKPMASAVKSSRATRRIKAIASVAPAFLAPPARAAASSPNWAISRYTHESARKMTACAVTETPTIAVSFRTTRSRISVEMGVDDCDMPASSRDRAIGLFASGPPTN
jgi:hypothetical protein